MPNYVKEKVQNILIEELAIPVNEVYDDGNLVKNYRMDDYDLSEITMALEEAFKVEIADEVSGSWMFVKDVVAYIEEATKPK